jgi:GNAT superfamily N-acetyltransferase
MLTYQQDDWPTFTAEARPLWRAHWTEIANHQDVIPLVPDDAAYTALDQAGLLHVVTARDGGPIVGYVVGILKPHLHYATTPHFHMDVLWLHPQWRKGLAGYRLLQAVERTVQQRVGGLVKILLGTKTHYDLGALYTRLGYTEIERTFAKVLKGD